ncbi:hypothetical protein G6F43_012874 [Rhizopus delemar]|nr:hypothetical protein G6F43_012874 [Rhizopus delemar]
MPLNNLIRGPPEVVASLSLPARRVSTTPAMATQSLEQTMELDRMEETLVWGPKSKPKKPLGRDSRMSVIAVKIGAQKSKSVLHLRHMTATFVAYTI